MARLGKGSRKTSDAKAARRDAATEIYRENAPTPHSGTIRRRWPALT
jgi:hypothetical protein